MVIKRINPCEDQGYDQYVISHPRGTFYHLSLWKEVLEQTYGYEPYYLASLDDNNEIDGILPLVLIKSPLTGKRFVSLPFSNVCGPLGKSASVIQTLVKEAIIHTRELNCNYLELRTQGNPVEMEVMGFHRSDYFQSSIVKLSSNSSMLWSNFPDRSLRKDIRKAIRSGIKVKMDQNGDGLKQFYKLLLKTRKKHGLPPQPYSFFENLWAKMYPSNYIKLLLAEYEGKIIAGLIILLYKKTVIGGYIGSDSHYMNLRPHQFICWKAMEWGCENGFQYFDFLRTAQDNEGLKYYKKRWGSNEIETPYFYYPKPMGMTSVHENSLKYRMITAFWRKIPSLVTPMGGRILYRHFG
jgi:FemAB-related protein (PEP-CTERM system-associated)